MTAPDKKRRDEADKQSPEQHSEDERWEPDGDLGHDEENVQVASESLDKATAIAQATGQYPGGADEASAELAAVSNAIGSEKFMDPPDGGDVPLSEQVSRMRTELERLRKKVAHYERDLHDGHQDRSQDTDWLRAGFLQRGAEIERLEDRVRNLAHELHNESVINRRKWRTGKSQHYEGRSDQAAEDAERLLKLLKD